MKFYKSGQKIKINKMVRRGFLKNSGFKNYKNLNIRLPGNE